MNEYECDYGYAETMVQWSSADTQSTCQYFLLSVSLLKNLVQS